VKNLSTMRELGCTAKGTERGTNFERSLNPYYEIVMTIGGRLLKKNKLQMQKPQKIREIETHKR
jgi:hypothetical protein